MLISTQIPLVGSNQSSPHSSNSNSTISEPITGDATKQAPSSSVKVSLSSEGKALLETLQSIQAKADSNDTKTQHKATVGEKVESFAHGALGIEHPDELAAKHDAPYSAGQYLSAAATVGGMLLMLV